MFECEACKDDPTVHSFYAMRDTSSHTVYYSCEKEIKDNHVERILMHIDGMLREHTSKTWSWVMDANDFTLGWDSKDLAYGIMDMMEKYSATLTEVRIINMSSFMKKVFSFGKSFLSERLQSVIREE